MSAVAAAIGVGAAATLYAASKQASAAKKAAQVQADAANRATDVQKQMFDQNREDMSPWRNVGQGALYNLADLMGIKSTLPGSTSTNTANPSYLPQSDRFGVLTKPFDFANWKDPGYDFRFSEGQKALERSAAARGDLFSGAYSKALTRWGQDYGSNEFMNAYNRWQNNNDTTYNRLAGLAGTGQSATSQIGAWGQNTAANIGNNLITAGNATAQGYQNAAAAMASGYTGAANAANSGINNYLFLKTLKGL